MVEDLQWTMYFKSYIIGNRIVVRKFKIIIKKKNRAVASEGPIIVTSTIIKRKEVKL